MVYPFIPIEHREYPNTFLVNTALKYMEANFKYQYFEVVEVYKV